MAGVECENFVGNAWKKDLCLNCFKSKEEHRMRNGWSVAAVTRIPDPPKEGILKGKKSGSSSKGNKVNFLKAEFEVIGFGGDDVYSDEEECGGEVGGSREAEEEDEVESEEERAFQKLTKTNTDYNSIPENLREPKEGEVKKVVEPLQLGKQVFDEKGNKKTLLVSVTPFGDQTAIKNRLNVNGFRANGHQSEPEDCKPPEVVRRDPGKGGKVRNGVGMGGGGGGEGLCEGECVVNGGRSGEEESAGRPGSEKSLKRSQPLDKNLKFKVNKASETNGREETEGKSDVISTSEKVSSLIEKARKKVEEFPIISQSENLKVRTRELSFEKKQAENNKGVVLDMYRLRENGDVKSNKNGVSEEKTIKSVLLAPEIRNKFLSSEVKVSPSVVNGSKEKPEKLSNGLRANGEIGKSEAEIVENGSGIIRNKLIPNVSSLHRHHFRVPKTDGEEGVKGVVEPRSPNGESEGTEAAEGEAVEVLKEETETKAGEPEEKFKKTPFESFENFKRIIQGEEITLFSAEKRLEGTEKKSREEVEEEEEEEEKEGVVPGISRESAGEPDGRADSDEASEPPALPLKPPPPLTESRSSFLQDLAAGGEGLKASEKPKVPVKPLSIQSKKIAFQSPVINSVRDDSSSLEKYIDLTPKSHPPLQESLSSDSIKNQKRQAPKPPSPKPSKHSPDSYTALPAEIDSDDSGPKHPDHPPRDALNRISRSTDNLLELITDQHQKDHLIPAGLEEISVPEPVPRRSLSLSQDSLVSGETPDLQMKKKPSRGRFLLRKLLHLGKPKEAAKEVAARGKSCLPPSAKPKIEIIHPSDLSGSRVEVVPPARSSKSRRTSSSASSSSGEQRESDVLSDSSTSHSMSSSGNDSQTTIDRAKKPPPPPRANSVDTWTSKPARPPPPKSIDILRQANASWTTSSEPRTDNHYVNLGEARSGLAPNKPMRTGSLREPNSDSCKRLTAVTTQPEDSDYESFIVTPVHSTPSHQSDDNLYECVQAPTHRSSLPECDSTHTDSPTSSYTKEKRPSGSRIVNHRRSDGNVDLSSDYFKLKFMRSASLPYCSSETESEIYSPYSFCGSEMVGRSPAPPLVAPAKAQGCTSGIFQGEDDYESSVSNQTLRMSRLKLKKGRSIVHKNLEDNYGAVIVANHEALAQVVEQMRQGPSPPPALRALTTALNLRWTDFTIAKDAPGVVLERRVFYPALWGVHPVTLSLMADQGLAPTFHAKGPFNLNPLTELSDLVPASYLPMLRKDASELIQASISVLTRLQIETVETYGRHVTASVLSEESKKEVNFVLLQMINAFKALQAQGIEEAPRKLTNLIVCREEKDPHPRVCITPSFDRAEEPTPKTSLCQCVAHAIREILPPTDLTPLILSLLLQEKAVSLSQAKSVLEFSLWGPADIAFGSSDWERESALQRWLDLERATVLHGLVRTRAELTVFEEWQLLFLVRTSAKMMAEASWLVESGGGEEVSTA